MRKNFQRKVGIKFMSISRWILPATSSFWEPWFFGFDTQKLPFQGYNQRMYVDELGICGGKEDSKMFIINIMHNLDP